MGEAAGRRRSIALQRERTEGRQRHGAGGEQTVWQRRGIAGRSYHIVAQRVMSGVSDDRVMSCVSDEKASGGQGNKEGIAYRWAEPRASHRWASIIAGHSMCSSMGKSRWQALGTILAGQTTGQNSNEAGHGAGTM